MSKIWDEREKSLENEYFRRKEQELVEKLRAKRAEEKEREKAETSAIHCPKCDGTLVEVTFEDVQMLSLKQEQSQGWMNRLRKSLAGE